MHVEPAPSERGSPVGYLCHISHKMRRFLYFRGPTCEHSPRRIIRWRAVNELSGSQRPPCVTVPSSAWFWAARWRQCPENRCAPVANHLRFFLSCSLKKAHGHDISDCFNRVLALCRRNFWRCRLPHSSYTCLRKHFCCPGLRRPGWVVRAQSTGVAID